MSVLDKLDLLTQKGDEFEADLHAAADRLLARYDEVEQKKAKVFERRHAALADREKKIDTIDAALDRMSNLGNSTGSSGG